MDEGLSFEGALERLEAIARRLEEGGLRLEEAVALFEEGSGLVRLCHQRLDAAELKISQLQAPAEREAEDQDEP